MTHKLPSRILLITLLGLAACGPHREPSSHSSGATPPPQTILEYATECSITDTNPVAQSITQAYPVSSEQVMTWFCDGFSFEDITTALETSQAVNVPAQTLLDKLSSEDWNAIWQEVGFTPKQ